MPDSESYAYKLVIPNKEVREGFILQIQEWVKAVVAKDDDTMKLFGQAAVAAAVLHLLRSGVEA